MKLMGKETEILSIKMKNLGINVNVKLVKMSRIKWEGSRGVLPFWPVS